MEREKFEQVFISCLSTHFPEAKSLLLRQHSFVGQRLKFEPTKRENVLFFEINKVCEKAVRTNRFQKNVKNSRCLRHRVCVSLHHVAPANEMT